MDIPARRSQPGDDVVAGWFDAHARAIAGYATRRVGPTLASDIVADTFRIAWEQLDSYNPSRGGERAWLFGIASNLIRRHWRTEERRLRIQAQSVRADIQPVDPLVRVDEHLDARARYERIVDGVASLEPDDRDLLMLIAWEEMSSRDVAAAIGVPPGTVRSRLARIRTQLAHIVQQGEPHG